MKKLRINVVPEISRLKDLVADSYAEIDRLEKQGSFDVEVGGVVRHVWIGGDSMFYKVLDIEKKKWKLSFGFPTLEGARKAANKNAEGYTDPGIDFIDEYYPA